MQSGRYVEGVQILTVNKTPLVLKNSTSVYQIGQFKRTSNGWTFNVTGQKVQFMYSNDGSKINKKLYAIVLMEDFSSRKNSFSFNFESPGFGLNL